MSPEPSAELWATDSGARIVVTPSSWFGWSWAFSRTPAGSGAVPRGWRPTRAGARRAGLQAAAAGWCVAASEFRRVVPPPTLASRLEPQPEPPCGWEPPSRLEMYRQVGAGHINVWDARPITGESRDGHRSLECTSSPEAGAGPRHGACDGSDLKTGEPCQCECHQPWAGGGAG